MKAITICCLIPVWIVCSAPANAQLLDMFRRSPKPTANTVVGSGIPSVNAPRAGSVSSIRNVATAQFEQAIPDAIVPSPISEAATGSQLPSGMELPAPTVEYGSSYSAPPAETIAPPPAMELTQPGPVEAVGQPIYSSAPVQQHVDQIVQPYPTTGEGQLFDLPITNVMATQAAETYSTSNWFRGGSWYSRQEMVMLLRTDLPHQHIAVDASTDAGLFSSTGLGVNPNPLPKISTKDSDFTFEAGTRLTFGHRLGRDPANRDHAIEYTFFGLFDYTGRASLTPVNPANGAGIVSLLGSQEGQFSAILGTGTAGFLTINPIDGLTRNLLVETLHEADFNSHELNYVIGARPAKDRLVLQPDGKWVRHATPSKVRSMFVGFRYISQNDLFQYRGTGQNAASGGVSVPESDLGATYRVNTDNDLFGVQLGGEYERKRTEWVFGLRGKVGGLLNYAQRTNNLSQTLASTETGTRVVSTTVQAETLDDETLTFLAEAGLYLSYYVRPNTSFRLGYDILYMNGMATATNNLNIQGEEFARFELTGDSLYHGMNLGCEFTW